MMQDKINSMESKLINLNSKSLSNNTISNNQNSKGFIWQSNL